MWLGWCIFMLSVDFFLWFLFDPNLFFTVFIDLQNFEMMDRFVVREPRTGADYPQANQMMAYANNVGNNMMPEGLYYGPCPYGDFQNIQRVNTSVFNVPHNMNSPQMGQTRSFGQPNQSPMNMSGIDPRYLAGYPDNAQYVIAGQQAQRNANPINTGFGSEYQNRSFNGADRNKIELLNPQVMMLEAPRVEAMPKPHVEQKDSMGQMEMQHKQVPPKKYNQTETQQKDVQILSRSDKLKALHKTGPRTFSGPVEKVLKWHKSLQDIGVLILYEIVAKCVSVRSGDSCSKNLVVRDDNGPAMQVVYYEIDFLLPELKPPCTVRVIGRMLSGTSRLHAFNVRPATGDDVAMLPRRAAVAAHHVSKLCNEFMKV